MDVTKFDFPELSGPDKIFSTQKTIPALLEEARERGFYNGYTPFNKLFSELFFSGGQLKIKEGVDEEFKAKALPYLKAFMSSWEPSHQEKEAISALILSELVEA